MQKIAFLFLLSVSVAGCLGSDARFRAQGLAALAVHQHAADDLRGARETIALAGEMLRIDDSADDSIALMSIAWARARIGDTADAQRTLNGAERQVGGLAMTAFGQLQNGDKDGARESIKLAVSSSAINNEDRPLLSLILVLMGDYDDALAMIDLTSGNEEEKAPILATIAAVQAQSGDLSGMEQSLSRLRARAMDLENSNNTVQMLVTEGLVRALAGDREGVAETSRILNQFLTRQAGPDLKERKEAQAIAKKLSLTGLALAELARQNRDAARVQLGKAAEVDAGIEEIAAFDYSIAALMVLAGDMAQAREIAARHDDLKNFPLLLEVINVAALTLGNDKAAALTAIDAAQARFLALGTAENMGFAGWQRNAALVELAHMRLNLGDRAGAAALLNRLDHYDGSAFPIHATSLVRAARGDVAGALREHLEFFAEGSGHIWENMPVTGVVAVLQAKYGDVPAARQMLFRTARPSEAWQLMDKALGILAATRNYGKARDIVQGFAFPPSQASSLLKLADIARGNSDLDDAGDAIRLALVAADQTEHIGQRWRLLADTAEAARLIRDPVTERKAMDKAVAAALDEPSPRKRVDHLLDLAKVQARAGSRSAAIETAGKAVPVLPEIDIEHRTGTARKITRFLMKHEDLPAALAVADALDGPSNQARLLKDIALQLVRLENTDAARSVIRRAARVAEGSTDPHKRFIALSEIAMSFSKIGPAEEVLAKTDQALRAMRADPRFYDSLPHSAMIGLAYWNAGAVAMADQTFSLTLAASSRIRDPEERIKSLLHVARLVKRTDLRGTAGEAITVAWNVASGIRDPATRRRLEWRIRCTREKHCGRKEPEPKKRKQKEEPRALAIAGPVMDHYDGLRRLLTGAEEHTKTGDFDAALKAADKAAAACDLLTDPALKAVTLVRLGGIYRSTGASERLETTVSDVADLASGLEPSWLQMHLYTEAAQLLLATGNGDKAVALSTEAVESFRAFNNQY